MLTITIEPVKSVTYNVSGLFPNFGNKNAILDYLNYLEHDLCYRHLKYSGV